MAVKCTFCNGSGEVAVRTNHPMSYAGPGPVPDDARGVEGVTCWCCKGEGTVPDWMGPCRADSGECRADGSCLRCDADQGEKCRDTVNHTDCIAASGR